MLDCKVSMHLGKKYNIKHNTRDFDRSKWNKDGHIDESRSHLNEVITDENLRDFFEETFSKAIADYNEKNTVKPPDRITTVSEYYAKNKNKAQEIILQLGDHETYEKMVERLGQEKADDFYKAASKKAFSKWQKDNPSLKVFCAAIHMDEQTPHLHIDFLPVAESKRGLTTKVSLDGALKQIGFARKKEDKYDKTPYKRWLFDRRKVFEEFYQKTADELLGKGVLNILPSEPTTAPHQETWEHRQTQNKLAKVNDFLTGKGAKKVTAAEEIIANAKQVYMALCNEGNQRIAAAQRREGIAARKEKAANNLMVESEKVKNGLEHNAKVLNSRIANQEVIIEKEIQKRLAPHNFFQKMLEENDRYLQKQRSIFAEDLKLLQEEGKSELKCTQELFQKAKYKKTKGDFER